ncbi:MAG: hypothetical protein DMF21_10635 [Verrucomicrobia bacterium]|nr:MAG: hypothetical protein DMF21_10635 [Verrucomicrobiota bacterium]
MFGEGIVDLSRRELGRQGVEKETWQETGLDKDRPQSRCLVRDGHGTADTIHPGSLLIQASWVLRRGKEPGPPAKEAKTNDTRHARSILNEPRVHEVRAEIDESIDKINGKIQRAEQMKVHTMFVIGRRDMDADAVSVRIHGKGNLGAKSRSEAMADILLSMKERRA